ncbi:MAG: UDP-N-acetylmuramate dehydrogenase [Actinomycetales bacterium]
MTDQTLADQTLAGLTTLRVGGPARAVRVAESREELVAAVRELDAAGEPLLVVGGGSNLLVADTGVDGTVVLVRNRGLHIARDHGGHVEVTVEAGHPWDDLVAETLAERLMGLEALSGIPGCTGATPVQNVGAYGQEVAQVLTAVVLLERASGQVRDVPAADLGLAYRTSRLKGRNDEVVLAARFRLRRSRESEPVRYAELARALGVAVGDRAEAEDVREAVLALRRGKGMVLDPEDHDTWSAGSFFTNPFVPRELADRLPEGAPRWVQEDGRVKTSAAWLIEHAGFSKGYRRGRAGLSTKHTLALTNRGGATAAEIVELAREVRDGVRQAFGLDLHHEPVAYGVEI